MKINVGDYFSRIPALFWEIFFYFNYSFLFLDKDFDSLSGIFFIPFEEKKFPCFIQIYHPSVKFCRKLKRVHCV